MRNVFLIYMPLGNTEAMIHYQDTIKTRVSIERVATYLGADARSHLNKIFGARPMAVWGSAGGKANQAKFDKMQEGDELVIVEGDRIKLIGHIALKVENADLSRELWKPLRTGTGTTWELVYLIAKVESLGSGQFRSGDLALTSNGKPVWERAVRRARKPMIDEGFMEAVEGGRWRLTKLGRDLPKRTKE